jgi:hypothetical protein
MMGSDQPLTYDEARMREVLGRPGILEDISSAYDSKIKTVDAWITRIGELRWIDDEAIESFTGPGELITDDRPIPEYFLLRRMFRPDEKQIGPGEMRALTRG